MSLRSLVIIIMYVKWSFAEVFVYRRLSIKFHCLYYSVITGAISYTASGPTIETLNIMDSTFMNNTAQNNGGGMCNFHLEILVKKIGSHRYLFLPLLFIIMCEIVICGSSCLPKTLYSIASFSMQFRYYRCYFMYCHRG